MDPPQRNPSYFVRDRYNLRKMLPTPCMASYGQCYHLRAATMSNMRPFQANVYVVKTIVFHF